MTKSISDIIQTVHSVHWSYPNTFSVSFSFGERLLQAAGISGDMFSVDKMQLVLEKMPLPSQTGTTISDYLGAQEIKLAPYDKLEVYQLKASFRDRDQLMYYRALSKIFAAQKRLYVDDIKFIITWFKEPDYASESTVPVAKAQRCVINDISEITYDQNNSEGQIATFELTIHAAEYYTL